ncbi:MAG: S-layer homology domain-containing protein [Clostridiales bacterium]|nr:S-layer homology domain-containing protein [Clostridiales bacterium]
MKRKLIIIALVFILAFALHTLPAFAEDGLSLWAEAEVNEAIGANLVPWTLQADYTRATTRAEFCALAVALYESVIGNIRAPGKMFDDTDDPNVAKAAAIGVVTGVGNNKFDPNAKLTREQAAVMLSRLADAIGNPLTKKTAAFNDSSKISAWAVPEVGQAQGARIMGGVGNNTFAPKDPYTREQSIVTIFRTFNAVKGITTSIFGEAKAVPAARLLENYILSAKERRLYNQLVAGIANFEMKIAVDSTPQNNADVNMLGRICDLVYNTHPEFFWWNGTVIYSLNGKPADDGKYALLPFYQVNGKKLQADMHGTNNTITYPQSSEITAAKNWLDQEKTAIRSRLNDLPVHSGMTRYELELATHDWLVDIITYETSDHEKHEFNTIQGALIKARVDCTGYSRTFQYIMGLTGIESVVIFGVNEELHMWNAVKLDGQWYQTDVTFDDTEDDLPWHFYFNRTDQFMAEQNYAIGVDGYPDSNPNITCTATEYNYYVMTDSHIVSDSDFISKVPPRIERARAGGEKAFELEFAPSYAKAADIALKRELIASSWWRNIDIWYNNQCGLVFGVFK